MFIRKRFTGNLVHRTSLFTNLAKVTKSATFLKILGMTVMGTTCQDSHLLAFQKISTPKAQYVPTPSCAPPLPPQITNITSCSNVFLRGALSLAYLSFDLLQKIMNKRGWNLTPFLFSQLVQRSSS